MEFFAQLPKCLIGTEACASSHHCARELITQGHEMKPHQAIHDAVVDLNRESLRTAGRKISRSFDTASVFG
jgi:hypothetical protein